MGAMTAKQVIDQVRNDLNDVTAPYDWDDTKHMIPFLNAEVDLLTRDRPDVLIAAAGTLITVTPATAVASTLSIDSRWKPRLVEGIKDRCFAVKGDGKENRERAAMHQANAARETMQ